MFKNPVLEAKGIWKRYDDESISSRWIMKELNLELLELMHGGE